jgi:nicotinate-nucleotide pyrophosphorylase (carboxylating)
MCGALVCMWDDGGQGWGCSRSAKGSISDAVRKCRTASGFSLKIEVEARSEVCRDVFKLGMKTDSELSQSEAREALEAGADIVMLDNFAPGPLKVSGSVDLVANAC